MIKVYLEWLKKILKIEKKDIHYSIYVHENKKNEIDLVKKYWAEIAKCSVKDISYIYFKKHKPRTKRHKKGEDYYGLLRIRVRKSTNLNRKVHGWMLGIVENYVSLS